MELDEVRDRLALEALNAEFAHAIDRHEVDALVRLFTEDAVYTNGARRSEGHGEIRALLTARAAAGRTSRHFYSGLRLTVEAPDRVRGTSLWLSYARNGPPPFASGTPFAIADFEDLYVRQADGAWRIRERHIRTLYVDPANAPP